MMSLGEHLKNLRGGRKVVDVAVALGVDRTSVHFWESERRRPEPEALQALLDLYDADAAQRLEAWRLRSLPRETTDDAQVA